MVVLHRAPSFLSSETGDRMVGTGSTSLLVLLIMNDCDLNPLPSLHVSDVPKSP